MSVFLDSNVILYAVVPGGSKFAVADRLLHDGGVVSVQVLNEFTSVALRKLRLGWPAIQEVLGLLEVFCGQPHALTMTTHRRALEVAERYRYGIYDATIVASALLAGCTTLYSEDMQDGQQIEALTIRNPFIARP